jgi:hypothetical protein
MANKKFNKPYFKVPIPGIAEKDKENDPKEKAVAVKLTTGLSGTDVPNPTNVFKVWFNVPYIIPF